MPTILLGFLLSWAWSISSRLLQQSAAVAPYLDEGYLLTAAIPDFQRGTRDLFKKIRDTKGTFHAKMVLTSSVQFSHLVVSDFL